MTSTRLLPTCLMALLALACVAPGVVLGETVPGAPLLRHYTAHDTKAMPGHLSAALGTDGELFVGNVEGVLRYDGVDWLTIPLPGRSVGRSLATGADGQIYVGGYDTFGRLVRGSDGQYSYEELLTRAGLRGDKRHVGIVWEVVPMAAGVYFRAEYALYFVPYGSDEARRWPLDGQVRSFYAAGGELYSRIDGRGLCRFVDGRFELVPGGEVFRDKPLAGLVDKGDWLWLVGRDGLYRADATGIAPLPGAAGTLLSGRRNYVTQLLGDGSIVVGTQDGELFRIGADFRLRERMDLGGFGIQALQADLEGGLWAATEGDLVRLTLPSPWSFLGEAQGLAGSPGDFEWHEGALWLASSRGVARLAPDAEGQPQPVMRPWTEFEASALHSSDAGLLIGLREGLLVLDAGASQPRRLYEHAYHGVHGFVPSRHAPDLVYGVSASDLLVLRERGGRWMLERQIPLGGISTYGIEETAAGELWIGDTRGPAQRWRIDLSTGEVTARDRFADEQGLAVDARTGTGVYQLDGRIHAVSGNRGFRLDGERFVADAAPPVTLVDRPQELAVVETPLGAYAFTSRQLLHRATPDGDWQPVRPGSHAAAGYSRLRVGRDGVLRIATWNGLLQFDPTQPAPAPQPLRLTMESVQARGPGGESTALATHSTAGPVRVPAGHGLDLRFAMVSMESGAEFRYLLHGVTPHWSAWTDRDLFIRALPPGDYVLEVQARTRNGRVATPMEYRFQVPPRWYELWWVRALGVLALAGLLVSLTLRTVRSRTERYLAANRRLESRIAERTRELEDANRKLAELVTEDALTGVANRRALENGLRREWYRCLDQRQPLSVLMIDVDNFKAYNDAHGHLEGDVQLRSIAQRLAGQHDPQRELLARYGGEEFALLLPGVHQAEALRRAEAIRAAVAGSDAGMTVSVGVAGFVPDVQMEPETLLRRADAALYAAKRAGRDRVEADTG